MTDFDYAAILADDPGGTWEEAVQVLRAMTVSKARDSYDVNVRTYASQFGLMEAEALRSAVEANFPKWVLDSFEGEGLNVCDPQTQAAFNASPAFTAEQKSNLMSFVNEDVPKYPGIKQVHIKKARL